MTDIKNNELDLSRREFLIGSVGASVVMGFGALGLATLDTSAQAAVAAGRFSPTVWFEIDSTGQIHVNIAKAEMGQHIGTALARIVADELGADWLDVTIRHVDTDPKWGYMVTGGSWSVFHSFKPLSQAGAAGRIALLEAGAKLLGIEARRCHVTDSRVHSRGQSVSFAEIVQRGELNKRFSSKELAPPAESKVTTP